jgi:eukaryotic-like serine/threonine-protein kinase
MSEPTTPKPAPGEPTAPGYELLEVIAQSGLTTIYRGRDVQFGRDVAIKVHQPGVNPERLLNEARITSRLPHPGIVPIHQLGILPDGCPFMVMRLVKGRTLADIRREDASLAEELPRLLVVFERVCQTVAFAHVHGVIHRNLKPSKVMIGAFGEVQVLGWGMARVTTEGESPVEPGPQNIVGTPIYMPPEQARGEVADTRSDVFGLGGLLCVILTGEPPFSAPTTRETLTLAASGDLTTAFAWLDACGADPELIDLAKRCLSPNREDRPADAGEVARVVTAYRSRAERPREAAAEPRTVERPPQGRQVLLFVLLLAAVLLLLVNAILLGSRP